MSTVLASFNADAAAIVERVRQCVVQVSDGRGAAGAGTIWHEDGLIVTNAHVIARAGVLTVTLADERQFPARVLAWDTQHDLAALAIDASGLPTVEPGDSNHVLAGQWVMALGHPWGIRHAVTSGVVIGSGADLIELRGLTGNDWLAVSLHLRPGHSGGPLFDVGGRLIGINALMTGPDVGAAIPVDIVKRFLKRALGSAPTTPAEGAYV